MSEQEAAYAKLFGVSPATVRAFLGSGAAAPAPLPAAAPAGPAPGDPGFAAGILGAPGAHAPLPRPPPGPAPGDPGFGLAQIAGMGSVAPPPPSGKLMPAIPAGAGSIDTSGVAPRGFASGAVHLPAVPKGAGQIDMSAAGGAGPGPKEPSGGHTPSAPGLQVIPGGWQHGSRGESVQHGVNPERLKEGQYYRDVAAGQGLLAGDAHLKGAQQQAQADVAYAAAHAKAAEDAAAQMQRLQHEKEMYIAGEHEKLNVLNTAAQAQIDPEAAKGSHASQLVGAIAVALNQFGAALTGGPNTALQIVNANIDRNLKAQSDNIAIAGRAADREQSLYRQNLEAFGDKERAVLATKMQYLDQAKAIADQKYAAAKSSMNEAAYHEFIQGLNDKKAELADQFGIRTEDRHTSQSHDVYRPAGVVGGATHEAKTDARWLSEAYTKAGIPQAQAQLEDVDQRLDALGKGDIPGVGRFVDHVPNALLGKEANANRQAVAAIKNGIRKSVAGSSLTDGEKAELDKQTEGAHDADSLRNTVQSFRRSLSNQQRNISAGAGPAGNALLGARGGSVKDIRTDKATTPFLKPVKDD